MFLAFLDTPAHTKYNTKIYYNKYYYIENSSEI